MKGTEKLRALREAIGDPKLRGGPVTPDFLSGAIAMV